MKTLIHASDANPFSSDSTKAINIEIPGTCPHCNTSYASKPDSTLYYESENGRITAYSIFFCPTCENCFFTCHDVIYDPISSYIGILINLFPFSEKETIFSSNLKSLSPNFVNIYNQAERAENQGLKDICGMGYRKALEFVVKDYAISFFPEKDAEVRKLRLSACINQFINNERIKTLSTASAWIGNDETHYTRKHEDYNLTHLKLFISAVASYIDSELTYREAENLLSTPSK